MSLLSALGIAGEKVLEFAEQNPALVHAAMDAIGGGCTERQLVDAIKEQKARLGRAELVAEFSEADTDPAKTDPAK